MPAWGRVIAFWRNVGGAASPRVEDVFCVPVVAEQNSIDFPILTSVFFLDIGNLAQ